VISRGEGAETRDLVLLLLLLLSLSWRAAWGEMQEHRQATDNATAQTKYLPTTSNYSCGIETVGWFVLNVLVYIWRLASDWLQKCGLRWLVAFRYVFWWCFGRTKLIERY
jgi:hypothetical protein